MLPTTTPELDEIYATGAQALERAFRPGHTVHLAIDWQRLYCDPLFSLKQAHLQRIQKITRVLGAANYFADAIRAKAPTWWVYHDPEITKDSFDRDHFLGVGEEAVGQRIAQIRKEGLQICGRVDPECDIIIRKPYKDAFEDTDLHERLQRREIDTLLITGLYRHYSFDIRHAQCVGQTMKAAADLHYKTFVVEDLTVGHLDYNDNARLGLARMTRSEDAYSVESKMVRQIVEKYQP